MTSTIRQMAFQNVDAREQMLDAVEAQVEADVAHSKATGEPIWMEPFVESELQAIRDLEAEMQADTVQD